MLDFLLGDSELFVQYKKYRRLSQMHPTDSSLRQSYDSVLARVQTSVSKIQNDAKKNLQLKEKRKMCEQLMVHWGMFFLCFPEKKAFERLHACHSNYELFLT